VQPIVHPIDFSTFDLGPGQSTTSKIEVHSTGRFLLAATGGIRTKANAGSDTPLKPVPLTFGWKLSDPDGLVLCESSAAAGYKGFFEITMDILNRVRDLAGFIRQPWSLTVSNITTDDFADVNLNLQIQEDIASSSGLPLLDNVSVDLLHPGISQTVPFTVNRLGQIQLDLVVVPYAAPVLLELLDPSGTAIPLQPRSGAPALGGTLSMVSPSIGLRELYQARKKGPHWSVRLSSSSSCNCHITAQVYSAVTIPNHVVQDRVNAIFGADGTSLTLSVEYTQQKNWGDPIYNFVCLTIHDQNVVLFFDSFGVIDTLESLDRSLRTPGAPPPLQPADPVAGTTYRIFALGALTYTDKVVGSEAVKFDFYLRDFATSSIRIVLGAPSTNPHGAFSVNLTFAGNPSIDINDAPDLTLSNVSIFFDLIPTWMADTKRISLVPQQPATGAVKIGSYNWTHAPDGWIDAHGGDPGVLVAQNLPRLLNSLGAFLKTFTESIFFILMGGIFDFTPDIEFANNTFVFPYASGEEEPVGVLNRFYHPGAPMRMDAPVVGSQPTATTGLPVTAGESAFLAGLQPLTAQIVPPAQSGTANPPAPPSAAPSTVAPVHETLDTLHIGHAFGLGGIVGGRPGPNWNSPNLSKIDHIVVLMKENRSFDHVLGHLSLTGGRRDIDGLTPDIINQFPADSRPRPFPLVPVTGEFTNDYFPFDPDHSSGPVALQINNSGGTPMHGFIPAFLIDYPYLNEDMPTRIKLGNVPPNYMPFTKDAIMGYHTPETVPYYSQLAQQYTVCDRYFSSHPGPTFPNRFFFLSGKLETLRSGEPQRDNGVSGFTLLRQNNLFDELTARGVSWKYYESPPDVTMLRTYARYAFDDTNIRPIEEFLTVAAAGQLPSVTFIDPNFHYGITNDDHPPTSISGGQNILQQVIEALQVNHAAWSKTLFVFTYDEHGSIFDHVTPPVAEFYDNGTPSDTVSIGYGVRVPTIVVSPLVEKICTHTLFDHCSILKTVLARFCADDPPILSDRVAFANDLGPLLTRSPLTQIFNQGYAGGGGAATAGHGGTGTGGTGTGGTTTGSSGTAGTGTHSSGDGGATTAGHGGTGTGGTTTGSSGTASTGTHSSGGGGGGGGRLDAGGGHLHMMASMASEAAPAEGPAPAMNMIAHMEITPQSTTTPAPAPTDDLRLMAHMELAPLPSATPPAPVPRASTLAQPNADWHGYMARLSNFLKT
jgi:phospholipase C